MINLLGGLAAGFAHGKTQAQDRRMKQDLQKAQIDLSKQHARLYEQQIKVSGLKEQMQAGLMDFLKQPDIIPAGGAPPAISPQSAIPKAGGLGVDVPYAELINKAAAQHGVDPFFMASLIKNESGFNPQAVSPKGAQGIMQFMPGTAAAMGVTNPFDPTQAIPGGTKYIKQLLDEFGSYPLAAAAYNAGEGAVRKYGGVPPYPETQNFVQNVQKSLPEFIAQEQLKQQMERPPEKTRSSGLDIRSMPMQKRVAMDVMFKNAFDVVTKFRENKTKITGDAEKGFQVWDKAGKKYCHWIFPKAGVCHHHCCQKFQRTCS